MKYKNPIRAKREGHGENSGFSLIELLIVVAIIVIIAAIAIPNLLRARMAANETSAAENIRTITTASVIYNTTYGNGFPPDLQTLGGPGPTATCDNAVLLDQILSASPAVKSGYTFEYTGGDGDALLGAGCTKKGFNGYLVTATPLVKQVTGQRSFCANEPAAIYFDAAGKTAPSENACVALPVLQ